MFYLIRGSITVIRTVFELVSSVVLLERVIWAACILSFIIDLRIYLLLFVSSGFSILACIWSNC